MRVPHPPTRLRNGSFMLMPSSLSVTVSSPFTSNLVIRFPRLCTRIHSLRPHVTPSLDAPSDICTRKT